MRGAGIAAVGQRGEEDRAQEVREAVRSVGVQVRLVGEPVRMLRRERRPVGDDELGPARRRITYGCGGPVREDISCPRWLPFPHARFTIRQVGPAGQPLPQIVRLVDSDARARFVVPLSSGDYLLTPLAQQHARGGKRVAVHIQAGSTTRVTLRWLGYPQMV